MNTQADSNRFATLIFDLLDRATTTSTYKYAVLLGILDCCQSQLEKDGSAPESITTRQLARKVLELYWGQARPFQETGDTLKQNSGSQAKILTDILTFRSFYPRKTSTFAAERDELSAFTKLLNALEWSLIEMPLPRLQWVGGVHHPFLYEIGWSTDVKKGRDGISEYQKRFLKPDVLNGTFDNRILLKPGVGEFLNHMGPLLRPLIQREWASTVSNLNGLKFQALEDFLFAPERIGLAKLVEPLRDAQEGCCFYCLKGLHGTPEVDHFIPWSRSPNDGLHNFVLAHKACNGSKSNHLADVHHLGHWVARNSPDTLAGKRFRDLIGDVDWLVNPSQTLSIARSLYLAVPAEMPLWRSRREFSPADPAQILGALG